MAFMVPHYYKGRMRLYEGSDGPTWVEESYWDDDAVTGGEEALDEDKGYFVELTAPGYMDRTGWEGAFETEAEARRHVINTWEVDPDSGDELPEDATDEDIEAMVDGTYEYER